MSDRFYRTGSIFRPFWDLGNSAAEHQLYIVVSLFILLSFTAVVFNCILPIVFFRTISYYLVVY